ncbi:MAG: Holliday junction resolvase Hjc [Desulfurococcaceae archaeon]
MPSKRSRGFAHERDLLKKLWNHGLAVMRAPASGSKAKRVLYPDVVAIYKGKVIVAEVKTTRKTRTVYIESRQIEKLLDFANRAGAEAYIALKVVGTGEWFFIPVSKLERMESGRYKLGKDAINEGVRLEALISLIKGVKKLSEFSRHETSP